MKDGGDDAEEVELFSVLGETDDVESVLGKARKKARERISFGGEERERERRDEENSRSKASTPRDR